MGLRLGRLDEVGDHRRAHRFGLREPTQKAFTRRLGHIDDPVEPRDDVPLELTNGPEHRSGGPDVPLVHPFVGLRHVEVDRHYDALVARPACPKRSPRLQGALGVDDGVIELGQFLP